MVQEFQARAGLTVADVDNPFVPSRVGVGALILGDEPLAAVYLEGCFTEDVDAKLSFTMALDVERTAGLLVQLRQTMTDLGVPDQILNDMMTEARERIAKLRAMDAAPVDPPSFTCPTCKMVSYNPNDIAESYCGNCHTFTRDL